MKEINQIKITQIATVLQTIPGNNVVNGEPGIAIVRAKLLNNFGKELIEILEDEMMSKKE